MKRLAAILGLLVAAVAMGATGASAQAAALERTNSRGPVEVTVRLSPAEPVIGDILVLELEVRAEEGVELLMPEFGDALERFLIVDFAPREEIDIEGRTRALQRYRLQAPMSGKQSIPPLLVEFVDRRPGQKAAPEDADAYEIETERIQFEVASVLPEDTLAELRPLLGRLVLPGAGSVWTWVAIAALAAAIAIALPFALRTWLAWRARAREHSAYDIASAALSALAERRRPGAEEMDTFYVELSRIIRLYLEDRFGLRSPELTTEEFLAVASGSPDLTQPLRTLLQDFLGRADLVKFAGLRPEGEEVEDSLRAARRFLDETYQSPHDIRALNPPTGSVQAEPRAAETARA